jgi:RecA/RadA recombinase
VTVDPSLREKIRAAIQADYGESTIMPGDRMPRPRRLPTGSLALNYVSGGGIPFAHMTRFWGPFSSGKTTAMVKLFHSAQNYGKLRYIQLSALAELSRVAGEGKHAKLLDEQAKREREFGPLTCMYVCAEKRIDTKLFADLGVTLKDVELVMDTKIEVIGDTVQRSLGGYHVIGVDSTTATISVDELGHKDGIYGVLPMLRATRWGVNMDWWRDRLSLDNCIVFTSHSRAKTGAKTGFNQQAPEHPPGGYALNHEPGLILRFMKGGSLRRKPNGALEAVDADTARGTPTASAFAKFQPAGGELIVRCEKNTVGVQGRVALLHHDKRTGDFDAPHEYEKFAAYFRVLEKSGSWWTLPDGKKTQQARSTLQNDEDLCKRIEAVVLRCADDAAYEARLLAGRDAEIVGLPSAAQV